MAWPEKPIGLLEVVRIARKPSDRSIGIREHRNSGFELPVAPNVVGQPASHGFSSGTLESAQWIPAVRYASSKAPAAGP